jgi:hypothetical protein
MKLLVTLTSSVFFVVLSSLAIAAPKAIQSAHYIELEDYTGMSFLQLMILDGEGIADTFDDDYDDVYDFARWEDVEYAVDNFDTKNRSRVLRVFDNDLRLMKRFTEKLRADEKTFSPMNVSDKVGRVMEEMDLDGNKYALGQFYAIASGAGTLIRIDEDNYFYNIGYEDGEVRSGRSYGATHIHNANDASHLMYLHELEKFLTHDNDYRQFFKAIMDFLTETDVSVYDDPSFNKYAEAVLTDYITVYTAELRRHLMRGLHPYKSPWGNDMTEATFLSLFNVDSGLMMLEGQLVEEGIKNHWALSKTGSGRSGFGINRKDRRLLQKEISDFYRDHSDAGKRVAVERIDDIIGTTGKGDVYRGVMEFLNSSKNLNDSKRVSRVEDELTEAFVDFLMLVHQDYKEIVKALKDKY